MSSLNPASIPTGHRQIRGVAVDMVLGAALPDARGDAAGDGDLFILRRAITDTMSRATTTLAPEEVREIDVHISAASGSALMAETG